MGEKKCRICGSGRVVEIGAVEFYEGFRWPVFSCESCRCRFTQHQPGIYDALHADASSRYGGYRDIARQCKALFDQKNVPGLRAELSRFSKYKFVVDFVTKRGRPMKMLEVGCARGMLTSYFILDGYEVIGADVSTAAIAGATADFGPHFCHIESQEVMQGAPFDVIYHTGMIGCVDDPIGITKRLIGMLKPGGVLVFNAPNVAGCVQPGQLWLNGAPPPDLVTLFRKGFWMKQFGGLMEVVEDEELLPSEARLAMWVRRLRGRRWNPPTPTPLLNSKTRVEAVGEGSAAKDNPGSKGRRILNALVRIPGFDRLLPRCPTEFGLFVTMTKR